MNKSVTHRTADWRPDSHCSQPSVIRGLAWLLCFGRTLASQQSADTGHVHGVRQGRTASPVRVFLVQSPKRACKEPVQLRRTAGNPQPRRIDAVYCRKPVQFAVVQDVKVQVSNRPLIVCVEYRATARRPPILGYSGGTAGCSWAGSTLPDHGGTSRR